MTSENKYYFNTIKKAWVVAVDMGYGHQRTAYPLRDLAFGRSIINANNYEGIPKRDKKIWQTSRSLYEFVSRFRSVPMIGDLIFSILNEFQRILSYYPKRDLSKSNVNLKSIFHFIKMGWEKDLIERFKKNPLPIVTTFFIPAFAAESFHYPNDIYCIVCDSDANRSWASLNPKNSRIKYFAPNTWVRDRLKLYGVKPENIILTGYPLPKENIGKDLEIVKKDLGYRILNLDPSNRYRKLYAPLIKSYLGELPKFPSHPLTIVFSIGGAGAQKEICVQMIHSLKEKIKDKKLRFIISVGVRWELEKYFAHRIKELKLDGWVHLLSGKTTKEYFEKFNDILRTADILITKPSELSFYAGLGIPIIIAPPLGSQEDFNKRWLLHIGSATPQQNPRYIDQWLFDMMQAGDFAEMAMQGFIEMEKMGTYNIERIIANSK